MFNYSRRIFQLAMLFLLVVPALGQEPRIGGQVRMEAWQHHQQMASESPFSKLPWQTMGPKFAGGRIESIDAPRGDLATIYLGVGSGGIWKTVNAGLTWTPIFNQQSTYAIGDLTIAPSDPNTIWVGTGECHIGRSSYPGTGVFKSVDAGETWTPMGLVESHHIGQIAIDPVNPQVVYIAAMGRRKSGGQRGIYKTMDGGQSFRQVLFGGDQVSFVDLVIDPNDPGRLYATAWDRGNGPGSGVFRSTDHGETWTRLEGGLLRDDADRVAVAVSASRPGVVYALMTDRSSPKLAQRRDASILFRSDDFGETWKRTHEGYVPVYVGWDFCDIRVAPDDPDRVYIGGFRLIVSPDGGRTFVGERGWAPHSKRGNVFRLHSHTGLGLHLDVHDIWIDPEHPERVLLGNDGGLFVSMDRAQTWLHLNNLPIAEFYQIYLDDQVPFRIWGGTQDNASFVGPSTARFIDGEEDPWEQVFLDPWAGGDGFATFPDPNDSGTVYFTQQNGDLKRARLGQLDSGRSIQPRQEAGQDPWRWAWDTPFFASRHSESTLLYCAAQRVLRSADRGDHWQAISPELTAGSLLALSESPMDPQRLVAGDGHGKLFFTTDGGEHWKASQGLPDKTVRDIVTSVHDPSRVYVAMSGRIEDDSRSYVFVTRDFGDTWESLVGNLPQESANAIAEDASTPGLLFLGTDLGVYASLDSGAPWVSLCGTLPTAAVVDLQVQSRDGALVAATHGLSLFLLDIEPIRRAVQAAAETRSGKNESHQLDPGVETTQPIATALVVQENRVHVAVSGDDRHEGTAERPLQSLTAAQTKVRQWIAAGLQSSVEVVIHDGTYELDRALTFGPGDAPPPGMTVAYRAAEGAIVIISGGHPVADWTRDSGGTWSTAWTAAGQGVDPESAESNDLRQLFVGNRRLRRARTPNAGYFRVANALGDKRTALEYDPSEWAPPEETAGMELGFLHDWSMSRVAIDRLDRSGHRITLANRVGAPHDFFRIDGFEPHARFFVENAKWMLDADGEFFLDREDRRLLLKLDSPVDPNQLPVIAPRLTNLISVAGTAQQPIRGLRFVGLQLVHTACPIPATGYAGIQASYFERRVALPNGPLVPDPVSESGHGLLPAAMTFQFASDCQVENCQFRQLGGGGVYLQQQSNQISINSCQVEDVGGCGIMVGETLTRVAEDGTSLACQSNVIRDNVVSRCGQILLGSIGIWVGIAGNTVVAGNEVSDLPYSGISVGWRWDSQPSGCQNNLITDNHIHHVVLELSDGAGIYTLGRQPGTELAKNRIHDIPANQGRAESNGIFMDEGSSQMLVHDNQIFRIGCSPIRFHKAENNTLRNNQLFLPAGRDPFRFNNTDPAVISLDGNQLITDREAPESAAEGR